MAARIRGGIAATQMTTKDHWDRIYTDKDHQAVSWYRPHLDRSLELLEAAGVGPDARVIDVGGGASTLVDDLLARGFKDVTVLDLSAAALEVSKKRLGPLAENVRWVVGDATDLDLGCDSFDVWHDRAVFHFLTDAAHRRAYVDRACCALATGGHIILATFAPDGPDRCSGLPVVRYTPNALQAELGDAYHLVATATDQHDTPFGTTQSFSYCLCNKAMDC